MERELELLVLMLQECMRNDNQGSLIAILSAIRVCKQRPELLARQQAVFNAIQQQAVKNSFAA